MSIHRKSNQNQNPRVEAMALTYSLLFMTLKPDVVKEMAMVEQKEKQQSKDEMRAIREQVKFAQKQAKRKDEVQQKAPQQHYNKKMR